MITRLSCLALGAVLLSSPLVDCISLSDIPSDTPVASLVSSAKSHLAQGNANDALTYFDVAISRDPRNYLTIFQRGATYLSLGKNDKASQDFDKVLTIRPDFEGALLQRAKIKSRNADWVAAKGDYVRAKKTESADFTQLEEAWGAASLASDAEKAGDWENCVGHAGTAIMVASTALSLRQLRARCRFERGEVLEGVSDLAHALQISPSAIEPHMQISTMMFYSMADTDKGIEQMRKCLRSDPDSKTCSKLFRREKQLDKVLKQAFGLKEKRQFNSAVKLLVGTAEDSGLMQDVKGDVKEYKEANYVHENSPNELYSSLVEMACECYTEINKKKAAPYCTEALTLKAHSLPGLIAQAQTQIDAEDFEAAIDTLNLAKEHHPAAQNIPSLLQNAHTLLKRSKTKDYYKVLSVPTDADGRAIKKAYRTMTKKYHPDKASSLGVSEEQAAKKMADINEAYEVLSDPELRARFDRGDDPNNPEQQGQPFHGSPFGQGPGGFEPALTNETDVGIYIRR
ncbi:MAG: hypothetical protein ASARMPREDX12_004657 [Alectoria sarmentosa]|nr:MAG: hypothetical protein ASARMPREDX12_004657 [Alectoria sarmentosa]